MPWLSPDALAILSDLHPLPTHLERILSKFNLDKKDLAQYHVNKFMLAMRLLNVEHIDVVCKIFSFMSEGKASTWYFSLTPGSIHSWDDFKITF